MTTEIIISTLALIVSAAFAVWTVWYNIRQTKVKSIQLTRNLFNLYYSQDMLRSRDVAWFELASLNQGDKPIIFSTLWSDPDEMAREKFDHIQHVLQFWFQLYALDNRLLLDRGLAVELFRYDYVHWRKQFWRLVEDTKENDPDPTRLIHVFTTDRLGWLTTPNKQKAEPT